LAEERKNIIYLNFKKMKSQFLLLAVIFGMTVSAKAQQGYYYRGYTTQAQQTNGTYTTSYSLSGGGVTVNGYGASGYTNTRSYSYPTQRTVYQNVPNFYYSNGNSCGTNIYNQNQLPNGSTVYGVPRRFRR
jgi:hypothetical protein